MARRVLAVQSAFFSAASFMLVACGAVLGLRDIDEAPPAVDAASPLPSIDGDAPDASMATDGAMSAIDAALDADGGATGPCAAYPTALMCDDFESGQFAKGWQLVQQGVTPFAKVSGRNGAVDGGANQREAYFGFSPIPNSGVSALSFPMANGRRSLRFEVNAPLNGWPPSGVGLARMVDASHKGIHIVAEQVGDPSFRFAVRADDADGGTALVTNIGYVVPGLWTCLEIEVDTDGTVRAWQGTALSVGAVSPSLATTPLDAQVGMIWDSIGNSGSKYVEIDDVVVGTGHVGCP